ncbi:hypothetical protein NLU13_0414 [Sarocladium strictum]|uniref:Uncharacterized protein n=1 Tax=Sarocladium strictum TaxID=5046 RepID=A0AA39GPS2_SARSR|nr:hypothetical protein NLU13_0414 [Sarocladium strictum]
MALQSPINLSSSYRPESSVVSRPPGPTYTTAGTIYNPNSTQPLQPPTRRGRSLKWNSGLPPDLTLLPKSLLSALPIHPHGSTRPVLPLRYSPLQQNYDRAISPSLDSAKPVLEGMTAQTPRLFAASMRSEALDDQKKQDESNGDDEDDEEEDELRMKALQNMPVKSLHNLASYPNPNQKIAQKVILRGVRSNLASTAILGLEARGPNSAGVQEDFMLKRREPCPHAAPTSQDSPNFPDSAEMGTQSKQDLQFVNHGQMRASLYRSNTEGSFQDEQVGYTTLASGPGVPRPLTAGPPGQRQYRPSTFDTTFKALRAKDMSFGMRDGASSPWLEQDALSSNMSDADRTSRDRMSVLLGDSTPFDPDEDFRTDGAQWHPSNESLAWQSVHSLPYLHRQMAGASGLDPNRASSPLSGEYSTSRQFSSQPAFNAPRTAEERLADRLSTVTSAWHSGQHSIFANDPRGGARSSGPGVIGDKSFPRANTDCRREHSLSMQEANNMSAAEHSRPLLELVLDSLERNLSWSHFSTPEPSLIDESAEGNKSLFG